MSDFLIRSSIPADCRWGYDDPSGVPEEVPVTLHLPEPLLADVQRSAARAGITPTSWVLDAIARSLRPLPSAAA